MSDEVNRIVKEKRLRFESSKEEKAFVALLSANTVKDAAVHAGLSEATLYRYLQENNFRHHLREARLQSVSSAVMRLQKLTDSAVSTLEKNLTCENPAVANKAAQMILDYAFKGSEFFELKQQMMDLEQRVRYHEVEAVLVS